MWIQVCFFLLSTRRGLRGYLYKILHGKRHRRRGGLALFVRFVKYVNKFPVSVVTAPSVNGFKKRLKKAWTGAYPHLPNALTPSPPAHRLLSVPSLYATQRPVMSMWFLQARCGLLFTNINLMHLECTLSELCPNMLGVSGLLTFRKRFTAMRGCRDCYIISSEVTMSHPCIPLVLV